MNSVNIVLEDAFKQFTLDQDKIMPPEKTVEMFRAKLKTLGLDILAHTRRIDNGRLDIPVFFSVCGKDARRIIGTKKQMGKGATPTQAEASAVMELAERFSFFNFVKTPENFHTATFNEAGPKAISFEWIARSVHDESDDALAAKALFADLPLKWTSAFNLTRRQEVLIPFDWFFAINEFNGPSAGNCTEEALSQGICEIVERHVSSLVSQQHLRVPAIDPASATDPAVVEMLGKYRAAGIELYLSDFSLETGIPTVGVLAYDPATFPAKSEIVWTAGTTPDPQKALSRALTETAQLAGDFNSGSNYVASGLPKFTDLSKAGFITHPECTVPIQALPDISHNNIRVEVENAVAVLAKRGMEVFVIDTMHAGLEIPAFYTIIPGAHFRERSLGTSVGMFTTKLMVEKFAPPTALGKLEKADKVLPEKYYIRFYQGLCHLQLGDPRTARTCFTQALELDPVPQEMPSIYSYLGACLKELEDYSGALEELQKGAQMDQERTDIYNLMGFCHFKLKEHEAAIDCFKKVIALDPSSAIDYANIATNFRELGRRKEAAAYYRMALEIDPGIDFARDNLARLEQSG